MKAVFVTVLCLFTAVVVHALDVDELGCPPEDLISPCTCQHKDLTCNHLLHGAELRKVFENVAGETFDQLWIFGSTLQYIPHDIFEKVAIREIYVHASTFVSLFDAPPTSLTMLETLHVQKSRILRTNWKHLTPLTSLKNLRFFDTNIKVLDETFGKSLPKSLKEIDLLDSKTRTIKPGAFHGLDNIEYLGIRYSELSSFSRDMFPTPFNAKKLSFVENKLNSIPKDLFTNMPNLKQVDLRVNNITTIPEDAFGEIGSQLDLLALDVNPLNCDCELRWLLTNGPKIRSGTCKTPVELEGKRLSQLRIDDFEC